MKPETVQFLKTNYTVDEAGCWVWNGKKFKGYGSITKNNKSIGVHRFSYEVFVGPIPKGLVIDHLCRNRACVNPAHLEAVTQKVNVLRGIGIPAINAIKTHCSRGHEFTEKNTRPVFNPVGRQCKKCVTIVNRWNLKKKMDRLNGVYAKAELAIYVK